MYLCVLWQPHLSAVHFKIAVKGIVLYFKFFTCTRLSYSDLWIFLYFNLKWSGAILQSSCTNKKPYTLCCCTTQKSKLSFMKWNKQLNKICMSITIVGIAHWVLGGNPLLTYWLPEFWFSFGYLASILGKYY
jgi:hypothetical protein